MFNIGEIISIATNEDYTTYLVIKENGNYAVYTKDNTNEKINSLIRSFKSFEMAKNAFERLK